MSNYSYKVVPFIGNLKKDVFTVENAQKVSDQLQQLINAHAQQGWEFYRIDAVQIQISPGCLAGLFGQRTSWITFDQVVFRQQVGP